MRGFWSRGVRRCFFIPWPLHSRSINLVLTPPAFPLLVETDLKELALSITTDPDHKFELALSLDDLDTAVSITRTLPSTESPVKWKSIGDRALSVWRFDLAREAFDAAGDLNSLLLLLLAQGDKAGLEKLSETAEEKGLNNLAFVTRLQTGDVKGCVGLLERTGRGAEGALFARTYKPRWVV